MYQIRQDHEGVTVYAGVHPVLLLPLLLLLLLLLCLGLPVVNPACKGTQQCLFIFIRSGRD
jgi:hypothetical protein